MCHVNYCVAINQSISFFIDDTDKRSDSTPSFTVMQINRQKLNADVLLNTIVAPKVKLITIYNFHWHFDDVDFFQHLFVLVTIFTLCTLLHFVQCPKLVHISATTRPP